MREKEKVFFDIKLMLEQSGFNIASVDMERPWGGFFVIDEKDAEKFIEQFFSEIDRSTLLSGKLSPKLLLVAPEKKLSWQYHHRRSEIWKLIEGEAGVVRSDTDTENEISMLEKNKSISLKKGERHRLVGLKNWGVIAEIWVHTDTAHPSDEDDIIRLLDDFGRKS